MVSVSDKRGGFLRATAAAAATASAAPGGKGGGTARAGGGAEGEGEGKDDAGDGWLSSPSAVSRAWSSYAADANASGTSEVFDMRVSSRLTSALVSKLCRW